MVHDISDNKGRYILWLREDACMFIMGILQLQFDYQFHVVHHKFCSIEKNIIVCITQILITSLNVINFIEIEQIDMTFLINVLVCPSMPSVVFYKQ